MELTNINERPIGIFDSGMGGLSICKEIVKILPHEPIIYLADSSNAPYGEKTKEQIIQLSIKNVEFLIQAGCKAIVVACNTATTNAINTLRERYSTPFIGIEPATKLAALKTKTGKIGVLATKGTLQSDLFMATSSQFRDCLKIVEVQGEHLVSLIEKGDLNATIPLLKKYLLPMEKSGVDSIVLGCTHYPFLRPIIEEIVSYNINIVDSGEAVAKQTRRILEGQGRVNTQKKSVRKIFYTNNKVELLADFLERINLSADLISYLNF